MAIFYLTVTLALLEGTPADDHVPVLVERLGRECLPPNLRLRVCAPPATYGIDNVEAAHAPATACLDAGSSLPSRS
jgi:hypothetical protein